MEVLFTLDEIKRAFGYAARPAPIGAWIHRSGARLQKGDRISQECPSGNSLWKRLWKAADRSTGQYLRATDRSWSRLGAGSKPHYLLASYKQEVACSSQAPPIRARHRPSRRLR